MELVKSTINSMSDLDIIRQNLIKQLQGLCLEASIEWKEEWLNPKDYTPPFEEEFTTECLEFHITLGKLIMLEELFVNK